MPLIKHPHKKLAPKVSYVSQPPCLGANDIPDPPWITIALCQFLKELPPPFREQLLVRLFAFFKVEIAFFYADLPPDEILEVVAEPPYHYEKFQRAILLVGALDYIFSEDVPWPPHVDEELMTAAGMHPNQSTNPIRHEPYLEARAKWKKLRSVYSDTALRKLEQALVKFLEQCWGSALVCGSHLDQKEILQAAVGHIKQKTGTKHDAVAFELTAQSYMGSGISFSDAKSALVAEFKKSASEEELLTKVVGLVEEILEYKIEVTVPEQTE